MTEERVASEEQPAIACSLSGAEQAAVWAGVQNVMSKYGVDAQRVERGAVITSRSEPGVRAAVDRFVEMEAQSCPSSPTMSVEKADLIRIRVEGPPDAQAVIDAFFANFAPAP